MFIQSKRKIQNGFLRNDGFKGFSEANKQIK